MKFFIVVIFALDLGAFAFLKPEFKTVEECMASASNPTHIQVYSIQMMKEYGRNMPIAKVVCVEEKGVDMLLENSIKQKKDVGV